MALQGAPPGAEAFLRRACQTALRFDEEGSAVLPVRCWQRILDELELQEDSEGAFFLMDFVEPHGEGYFTFEPLLEVVGMQPVRSEPAEAKEVQRPPEPSEGIELEDGVIPESFHQEQSFSSYSGPNGYGGPKGSGKGDPMPESLGGYPSLFEESRQGPCEPGARPVEPGRNMPQTDDMRRPHSFDDQEEMSVAPQPEVADEAFWQRRGPQIQALYYQWDCNRLTNDAFQAQMQNLLGESVDVTHNESEFFRLICKHRSARTMKFASLMSGLRRDAQNTLARRTGGSCVFGGSSVAGSYYEPSEIGSEAPSSAAGRPSGGNFQPGTVRGGRRHYVEPQDNPVLPPKYQPPRLGQLPENEVTKDFSSPTGSGARKQGPAPSDFWSRGQAPPDARDHDRADAMSVVSGVSEADTQRSIFQQRNRGGHGNILTWGQSARDVTPPKSRQGRLRAVDSAGMPRSQMSSSIFPQRH